MKKIDFTKLFHLKKRTITILIFSVVIIAVLFFNWRYFEEMIAENETANNKQTQVVEITTQMQDTSDNLAYLVQNYILTGDMQYFKEYWNIELHGEGRISMVRKLQNFRLEESEMKSLDIIRQRCDELEKQ